MKIKTFQEFDAKYYKIKQFPVQITYQMYKDMMEEIKDELEKLNEDRHTHSSDESAD